MNTFKRWMQAPQTHWFRKLLFQIHLWMGIGFGLYVLVISVTGSALLLSSPIYTWFEPKYIDPADAVGEPLQGSALQARMAEVYAGYRIGFTVEAYEPGDATYVVVNKDGVFDPRYFNQFTGEDLGTARPWQIKAIDWVGNVHDDLLLGRTGRQINGVGGALFLLMSLSGLLIWWQGRSRWHEGLMIKRGSQRRFLWQLHSFVGFWTLLLMVAWGVSGYQLGFPRHVDAFIDWLDSDLTDNMRPDGWLLFFRDLHFANIGSGQWARWAWIIVSLVPALMFISGFILWWRRVVRRRLRAPAPRQ